jgi:hypothetical protein
MAIFELYRGKARYTFQRRGAVARPGRSGMVLDAVVEIDEAADGADLALATLLATPARGPGELPDVGTLESVLQARAACCDRAAEGLACEHFEAELLAGIEKLRNEGEPVTTAIGYVLDRLDKAAPPTTPRPEFVYTGQSGNLYAPAAPQTPAPSAARCPACWDLGFVNGKPCHACAPSAEGTGAP